MFLSFSLIYIIHWLIYSYQPINLLWIIIFFLSSTLLLFFNFFNTWFFCILIILFLRGVGIIILYFTRISYQYSFHEFDFFASLTPFIFSITVSYNQDRNFFFSMNPQNYIIIYENNWGFMLLFKIIYLIFTMLGTIKILDTYKGSLKLSI